MKVHYTDCKGKTRYHDAKQAKRALRYIETRGERRGKTPQRYYECPICGGFHLSSRPDRNAMGEDQAS